MLRRLILTLMLLSSACASSALAGGRLSFRVEWPPSLLLVGEQVIYNIDFVDANATPPDLTPGPAGIQSLELVGGAELRLREGDPLYLTPFVALTAYWDKYWLKLESKAPYSPGLGEIRYNAALSGGIRW